MNLTHCTCSLPPVSSEVDGSDDSLMRAQPEANDGAAPAHRARDAAAAENGKARDGAMVTAVKAGQRRAQGHNKASENWDGNGGAGGEKEASLWQVGDAVRAKWTGIMSCLASHPLDLPPAV